MGLTSTCGASVILFRMQLPCVRVRRCESQATTVRWIPEWCKRCSPPLDDQFLQGVTEKEDVPKRSASCSHLSGFLLHSCRYGLACSQRIRTNAFSTVKYVDEMRRWMMHLETHHHVGLYDGRITCKRCSLGQNVRHPEAGAPTVETRDHHNEFACNTSFEHGGRKKRGCVCHARNIPHHHGAAHMWRKMWEGIVQPVGPSITLLAEW